MHDDYPATTDGREVPFAPSERPLLSEYLRSHILELHRPGATSPVAKSKFPRTWSDEDILAAVDLTLAAPDRAPEWLGDKIRFEREVDGQLIRVQVRVDLDSPEIWNAYPARS